VCLCIRVCCFGMCLGKKVNIMCSLHCCGSGMFYLGSRIRIRPLIHPGSDPRSWIRGLKKHRFPDPGSSFFFLHRLLKNFVYLSRIPDPDPTIAPSRIPDPDPGSGGKKAPDPVSRIRIRTTGSLCTVLLGSCLL
jgi:hypothetical protein